MKEYNPTVINTWTSQNSLYAIPEYMGSSLPVIANDSGGTNEIVFQHKNWILIPRIDVNLFAKNILYLLENESDVVNSGLNGRNIIEENFVINRMATEFITEFGRYGSPK